MTGMVRGSAGMSVAGLLVLSGCAADAPAQNEPEPSESAETETVETHAGGSDLESGSSEAADQPSGDDQDEEAFEELRLDFIQELGLGEPDSTLTYPAAGSSGAEVTLDVYPVEVQDDVMRLALVFYPEYEGQSLDFQELHGLELSGDGWVNMELAPLLIDRSNFKKYEVIRPYRGPDWEGGAQWAREVLEADVPAGEPFVWWGYLPAPEDEIDAIDVELPQLDLPVFDGVEVAQ